MEDNGLVKTSGKCKEEAIKDNIAIVIIVVIVVWRR